MTSFIVPGDLYGRLLEEMSRGPEWAGFFLADFLTETRAFRFREWRAVPESGFASRSDFHLVLGDEMRARIIKWAWDDQASLVEAHSHDFGNAQFSWSDLSGLNEWVPHLWWRLRGRPYAALVVDGESMDALAWIDGPDVPEQVAVLQIEGERSLKTTGLTLIAQRRRRGRRNDI